MKKSPLIPNDYRRPPRFTQARVSGPKTITLSVAGDAAEFIAQTNEGDILKIHTPGGAAAEFIRVLAPEKKNPATVKRRGKGGRAG